jgi:diguanylate cyclase (GGDEF)-like protein
MTGPIQQLHTLSLITSFVSVALMMWTGKRLLRNYRARLYFILVLSVFFYAYGQSQEALSRGLDGYIFWIKFQYFGIAFIPFALFALSFHSSFLKENEALHPVFFLLLIPGLIILIFVLGYPRITAFYSVLRVIPIEGGFIGGADRGPWYLLHIAQVVLALISSMGFYLVALRNSQGRRKLALTLMINAIISLIVVYILYIASLFPAEVDPIAITLAIISPIFVAVFYTDRLMSDLNSAKLSYFDVSSNPVFIFNRDRQLIDLNSAATTVFSISRKDAINRTWIELLDDLGEGGIDIIDNEQGIGKEISIRERTYSYTSTIFKDSRGFIRGMLRSLYDVTDIKRAIQVLEQEASTDTLTGLLTRGRWFQLSSRTLAQGLRFHHAGSILVLDLDRFKSINDDYGHQGGDAVLREVAGRIKSLLRSIDIIGRYGGEEIVVWLTETPLEGAKFVAEKIRRQIAEKPVVYGQERIRVTTSIGIYGTRRIENDDIHHFFKLADRAVYDAKQQGRDQVVVSEKVDI